MGKIIGDKIRGKMRPAVRKYKTWEFVAKFSSNPITQNVALSGLTN